MWKYWPSGWWISGSWIGQWVNSGPEMLPEELRIVLGYKKSNAWLWRQNCSCSNQNISCNLHWCIWPKYSSAEPRQGGFTVYTPSRQWLKLLHWLEVSKSAQNNQKCLKIWKNSVSIWFKYSQSNCEYLDLGGVYYAKQPAWIHGFNKANENSIRFAGLKILTESCWNPNSQIL